MLNATRIMALFIIAWLCFLALLVVAAKLLWKEPPPSAQTPHGGSFGQTGESADSLLLRNAFSECAAALNGFFDAAAPESRAQFVIDPLEAVQSLTTTDLFSPLTSENGTKKNLLAEVIHTPRGPAIETVWETRQGAKLDAVFFKDKETWKIDWREMVRYSPQSWALFLAETGAGEEEFRLLARERLEGERGQHHGMVLVFYSPHFGHMRDAGSPSPEFPVDIKSPDGRLLAAAFAAKKEGRGPFGSHMLSSDPEDLIRVRVRIRRNPPDTRPKFTLAKVIACHWFSFDEPGYDTPPAKGN